MAETIDSNSSNIFTNLKKQWATNNKFNVDIVFVGSSELSSLTKKVDGGTSVFTSEDVTPYIIDVQIPDLSNETIEEWVVNEYRVAMGRNSIEQIQVKFRDTQGFPLYKTLRNFIRLSTEFFPKDVYWDIKVKEAMAGSINKYNHNDPVFKTGHAILTSLSGLTFVQGEGEVAEFSATWKVGTVTGANK